MFATLAGLMAVLVVLGAAINSRFDGGSIEKALVGLLALPMLPFGNAEFSKGWLVGALALALIGGTVAAGGMPLLLSILFLGVASAAFWDVNEGEIPTTAVVEEYLDDEDLTRLIELGAKGLALQAEDERETARRRIAELEADNLRLVALVARAYKPAAAEMLDTNTELQEIFGLLPLDPRDPAYPAVVREIAYA